MQAWSGSEIHLGTKHTPSFHQERLTALWTLMGHWRQRWGRKVRLSFGSTSTLSILSWLALLWSCWCHFQTTYNSEGGFSTLLGLKSKQRNQINVDCDMRLEISSLKSGITSLMAQKKQHQRDNYDNGKAWFAPLKSSRIHFIVYFLMHLS